MPLRLASTARLADTVVEQFEQLISSGEWAVGSRIPPEQQLVEQLGVGRSTVREAVRALEHAGLLEPRRGDGTYVRARHGLSAALVRRTRAADTLEVLEVRNSIERSAARSAAMRRTDEDLTRIFDALNAQNAARDSGDNKAFLDADAEFHRAVIAATHNTVLMELWEGLSDALAAGVATVMAELTRDHLSFPGHDGLAEAIAAGDGDGAERAVARHIDAAVTVLSRSSQKTRRSASGTTRRRTKK
ncbi:FadR/GntR family transcriptional regulator [Goodfellowiella coeruleoviolacea]|uniref:DNA-binding transcriptional regulator, FadR family n=1 Tax=Goodfellowiella coeruleoviolacea TaxID=334858 RepID=A0AAE3G9E6_9PSEU|nr:FadR/GntR family transcriptional regulator [Goodfellowiella coeruleoviolacea]MCP2163305.1 DNA-binding transcriptional regulator, FadR family [Goodfellowiella coeruleoviolacea]